jgi:hypothetical protein
MGRERNRITGIRRTRRTRRTRQSVQKMMRMIGLRCRGEACVSSLVSPQVPMPTILPWQGKVMKAGGTKHYCALSTRRVRLKVCDGYAKMANIL